VQFAEAVSAPAQWARQSAEIRSNAPQFLIGVAMDMKFDHLLQLKKLLSFQPSGIALSAAYPLVAIETIRLRPL
jgi:hypothetical protein